MRRILVIAFLLLLAGMPAVAQETRGTISGTVRDAQGVIPGAPVKITDRTTIESVESADGGVPQQGASK